MKSRSIISKMKKVEKAIRENNTISYEEIIKILDDLDYEEFSFLLNFILSVRNNAVDSFNEYLISKGVR